MVIILLYIVLLFFCIIFPEITISTTKETVYLWATSVLPSLLPFFIISKMILYNGGISYFSKILKPVTNFLGLPEAIAFPLSMSLLCGYQTGSKTVAGMGIKNANLFGNICFSASPIFVIGTVGTVFLNNQKDGYILYVIHLCTLIIFSTFYTSKTEKNINDFKCENGTMLDAIASSINSILSVCGFMVAFNLCTQIPASVLPEKINVYISGIIEFTCGIKNSTVLLSDPMPIISFFLSFGGLCVISQCLYNLKNIDKIKFVLNRVICGLISFILCIIYKKTALYIPILITLIIVISAHILRRKKYY